MKILIVGKESIKKINFYVDRKYEVIFLLPIGQPPIAGYTTYFANFNSNQLFIDDVLSLKNHNINAVLATYEKFVYYRILASRVLGLPSMSLESALAVTDKYEMRSLFSKKTPDISPKFTDIINTQSIVDFVSQYGLPVIIKPTNLVKSLLIAKCNTLEECINHYQYIQTQIQNIQAQYGDPTKPARFIIEEFMVGTLHSVAGFADIQGNIICSQDIVDLQNASDAGYQDNFVYLRELPSSLPQEIQDAVLNTARKAIKALGLVASAAHVEIIVTNEGPKIVEIGGRIGGYRTTMYHQALGIDLQELELTCMTKEVTHFPPSKKTNYSSVREIFPHQKGVITLISGLDILRKFPQIVIKQKALTGQVVGLASQGYKAPLIITTNCKSLSEYQNIKGLIDKIQITTI